MSGVGTNSGVIVTLEQCTSVLSAWLGASVPCLSISRLHGGMCYGVFRLSFGRAPFQAVLKVDIEPSSNGLAREHARIDYVRGLSQFPAPRVYYEDSSRTFLPYSVLVLELIDGENLESVQLSRPERARIDHQLAVALVELHSHTRAGFGEIDAEGIPRWLDVFLPRLIDLRQDMDSRLPKSALADLDIALSKAPDALQESGVPILVHGDLWGGNIIVVQRPDGWHLSGVVDWPALQYADVEYELAYLEAWHTVTPAFFETYARHSPLREGYEWRRLFYWLHTYMLHTWLFGQDRYRDLTAQTAARIARG